jgi:hypothetical protein
MNPDSQEPTPLVPSRGALIVMAVLMAIALWGAHFNRPRGSVSRQPGFAFGGWNRPQITRVDPLMSAALDFSWALDPPLDRSVYRVLRQDQWGPTQSMVLIDHASKRLISIERFDSNRHQWPPTPGTLREPFSSNAQLFELDADESKDDGIDRLPRAVRWMLAGEEAVVIETIEYPAKTIQWARLRRSPVWPMRTHLGRCQLESVTLRIAVTELAAQSAEPNYRDGPLGSIVAGVRSLGD